MEKEEFLYPDMIKYLPSSVAWNKMREMTDTEPLEGKMTYCKVKRPKLVLSLPLVISSLENSFKSSGPRLPRLQMKRLEEIIF